MTACIKLLHWLCRLILAGVFIYSGYTKIQEPIQFAVAISGYKMVPDSLVFPMAKSLPWVEIILGLAILIGWKIRHFSAATAALLLFFIAVLSITVARGIEANCGCFGLDERISPLTILRDGLFLIPAIYLVFEPWLTRRLTARGFSGERPE